MEIYQITSISCVGSCRIHVHKGGNIAEKLKVILLKISPPPLSTYLALTAFGALCNFTCNVQMKELREWHAFIWCEAGILITGPDLLLGGGSERLPGACCYLHVLASQLSVLHFISASIICVSLVPNHRAQSRRRRRARRSCLG